MNRKEKRAIGLNWAFVLFAALLSFLINIVSTAMFDLYVNGFRIKVFILFVAFLAASVFFVGFLSYIFENMEKVKEEDTLRNLMMKYIKSWF
jgi:hypothetical protein